MNPIIKQSVAELLASLLYTFVGAGAICMDSFLQTSGRPGIGLLGIALAHAVGLAIAITMTMNVSGGYANPAITIGLLFVGKLTGKQAWYYIVAQIIGALIAGFFLTVLFSLAGSVVSSTGLGTPHAEVTMRQLFNREMDLQLMAMSTLIELIMTFLLTISIFGTIIDKRAPRLGGWGVGLLAMVILYFGIPFTGAAMNPARYIGTAVWESGIAANWSKMSDYYIYILGPVLGAVIGSWIYDAYVIGEEGVQ
jgi:MIP family channel proteins